MQGELSRQRWAEAKNQIEAVFLEDNPDKLQCLRTTLNRRECKLAGIYRELLSDKIISTAASRSVLNKWTRDLKSQIAVRTQVRRGLFICIILSSLCPIQGNFISDTEVDFDVTHDTIMASWDTFGILPSLNGHFDKRVKRETGLNVRHHTLPYTQPQVKNRLTTHLRHFDLNPVDSQIAQIYKNLLQMQRNKTCNLSRKYKNFRILKSYKQSTIYGIVAHVNLTYPKCELFCDINHATMPSESVHLDLLNLIIKSHMWISATYEVHFDPEPQRTNYWENGRYGRYLWRNATTFSVPFFSSINLNHCPQNPRMSKSIGFKYYNNTPTVPRSVGRHFHERFYRNDSTYWLQSPINYEFIAKMRPHSKFTCFRTLPDLRYTLLDEYKCACLASEPKHSEYVLNDEISLTLNKIIELDVPILLDKINRRKRQAAILPMLGKAALPFLPTIATSIFSGIKDLIESATKSKTRAANLIAARSLQDEPLKQTFTSSRNAVANLRRRKTAQLTVQTNKITSRLLNNTIIFKIEPVPFLEDPPNLYDFTIEQIAHLDLLISERKISIQNIQAGQYLDFNNLLFNKDKNKQLEENILQESYSSHEKTYSMFASTLFQFNSQSVQKLIFFPISRMSNGNFLIFKPTKKCTLSLLENTATHNCITVETPVSPIRMYQDMMYDIFAFTDTYATISHKCDNSFEQFIKNKGFLLVALKGKATINYGLRESYRSVRTGNCSLKIIYNEQLPYFRRNVTLKQNVEETYFDISELIQTTLIAFLYIIIIAFAIRSKFFNKSTTKLQSHNIKADDDYMPMDFLAVDPKLEEYEGRGQMFRSNPVFDNDKHISHKPFLTPQPFRAKKPGKIPVPQGFYDARPPKILTMRPLNESQDQNLSTARSLDDISDISESDVNQMLTDIRRDLRAINISGSRTNVRAVMGPDA